MQEAASEDARVVEVKLEEQFEEVKEWSPKNKGDTVEANWHEAGQYHPGIIEVVHEDGTFDVRFCDGDYERHVSRENLRALAARRRGISHAAIGAGCQAHAGRASRAPPLA